jgi:predicted helicase
MIETYAAERSRWQRRSDRDAEMDSFLISDSQKISWSESLKAHVDRANINFNEQSIRRCLYRPFTAECLYFDEHLIERRYQFPSIFPTVETEKENHVIWLKVGLEVPMYLLMVDRIPDILPQGGSQCFPFFTYAEDGTQRRENITDWALKTFRTRYHEEKISKWDIFCYVYALLHHTTYRERYAANLRRELPRIPLAPDFWAFANAGNRLAELHVNYENQPEHPLQYIENRQVSLSYRVEKMKLSRDKSSIVYNDFLTIAGIPSEAFEYRLGNRSALEWIVDQYQVRIDKRSGITNDPNRVDDPEYIVRLIGQVITLSLGTVKNVNSLPQLEAI